MTDSANFIVQVRWRVFFTHLRQGTVLDTPYPSEATHMTYDVADAICQKLRARGLTEAVVCDYRGAPMIAHAIENLQPVSEHAVKQFYDDSVTERDWLLFRAIAGGETPEALAVRLGMPVPELLMELIDVDRRITELTSNLHESNVDAQKLTALKMADIHSKQL